MIGIGKRHSSDSNFDLDSGTGSGGTATNALTSDA